MRRLIIVLVLGVVALSAPSTRLQPVPVAAVRTNSAFSQDMSRFLPGGDFARSWGVRITEVQTADVFGEEFGVPVRAEGVFLAIRMEVRNLTERPAEFSELLLVLRDASGSTYELDIDATATYTVIETDISDYQPETGDPTGWNAGATHDAGVVFNVPEDAGGFVLESRDGTFSTDVPGELGEGETTAAPNARRGASTDAASQARAVQDCAGLAAWVGATSDHITRLVEAIDEVDRRGLLQDASPSDAPTYRAYARNFADLADDQRALDPPPAAERMDVLVVGALDAYGESFELLADGVAAQDQTVIDEGADRFETAGDLIGHTRDEIDAISALCEPELASGAGSSRGDSSTGALGSVLAPASATSEAAPATVSPRSSDTGIEDGATVAAQEGTRLRESPSLAASVAVVVGAGEPLEVTGPPVRGDGLTWRPVEVAATGETGFVPEDLLVTDD